MAQKWSSQAHAPAKSGAFFGLSMYIHLLKLTWQTLLTALPGVIAFIVASRTHMGREWLPLFWRGCGATRERRLSTEPFEVELEKLPPRGLVHRWYEWNAETRSGRTQPGFDDWLAGMALPAPAAAAGIVVRHNDLRIYLKHRCRYLIADPQRGERVFECRIDGRLPIIAFVDAIGRRGPWLTLPKLLTIEEIVSLRPLTPP